MMSSNSGMIFPRQSYKNMEKKIEQLLAATDKTSLQFGHHVITPPSIEWDGDIIRQNFLFIEPVKKSIRFDNNDAKNTRFRNKFGAIIMPERAVRDIDYMGRKPYMFMQVEPHRPSYPMSTLAFHIFMLSGKLRKRVARMNRAIFRNYTADYLNDQQCNIVYTPRIIRLSDIV